MRGIVNLHPAYASVLVDFDPLRTNTGEMERALREAAADVDRAPLPEPRTVEVPVRYGGPDLDDVARLAGMTPEEVIALHSGADYVVYFLGFSPGFPYLGGMPEAIADAAPRQPAPAGAGGQRGHRRQPDRASTRWLRPADGASSAAPRSNSSARTASRPRCSPWATACASPGYDPRRLARLPHHRAGPRPLRLGAPGGLRLGRRRRAGAARGQPAGGQPRGRRRARNDAHRRRVRIRRAHRLRAHRLRSRVGSLRNARGALRSVARGRPLLPLRARRHRCSAGARQPLHAPAHRHGRPLRPRAAARRRAPHRR